MTRLDYDRVALILVEALYLGDKNTIDRWSISNRTIQNYRTRLKNDSELAKLFTHKKELFEREWAEEIPVTIRMAMRYIQKATIEMDMTPEGLHSITGALKIVAELGLTKDMIDAKLANLGYNRTQSSLSREMAYTQIPAYTE